MLYVVDVYESQTEMTNAPIVVLVQMTLHVTQSMHPTIMIPGAGTVVQYPFGGISSKYWYMYDLFGHDKGKLLCT